MLRHLLRKGWLAAMGDRYLLSDVGRQHAAALVRSHRLWEQYLASHAGLDATRIHDKAEQLEHFTDAELREQLHVATNAPTIDPHGSPIPEEIK